MKGKMKIHYKTIVLDEKNDLYSQQVIEKNRKRQIDYCCEWARKAIEDGVISITGNQLFLQELDPHDNYLTDYYHQPIKHCPFCGEPIEQIEEYRARLEYYPTKVPKKVTPAHIETRTREVRL